MGRLQSQRQEDSIKTECCRKFCRSTRVYRFVRITSMTCSIVLDLIHFEFSHNNVFVPCAIFGVWSTIAQRIKV